MTRYLPPILLVALLAITTLIGWRGSAGGDPNRDQDRLQPAAHRQRQGPDRHDRQRHQDCAGRGRLARPATSTIEYADWDDATAGAGQWTAEAETANANRAVSDPDVMVYLGTYNSGAAKISMPILNRADLLMISPANTWPGLTKPDMGDPGEPDIYRPSGEINYLRLVPTDDLQGPLGAAWAKELGVKRVYVLDDNEVYGKGIATLFIEACQDLGIEVLGHESIDVKAQEFKPLMATIKGVEPDLIYFGGTTQTKGARSPRTWSPPGWTAS